MKNKQSFEKIATKLVKAKVDKSQKPTRKSPNKKEINESFVFNKKQEKLRLFNGINNLWVNRYISSLINQF
tara:strand:- start:397 stop:609 length:213 start_codon:yes stop_codon:yes gene_type:complete